MAGFIYGGNTGISDPTELQRRRSIMDALQKDAQQSPTPRNVGEGIASIGKALASRIGEKRLKQQEADARTDAMSGFGRVTSALLGGQSYASPFAGAPQGVTTPPVQSSPVTENPAGLDPSIISAVDRVDPQHDHAMHSGQSHADWLRYSNQGATRNDPLSPELVKAMSFLPEMGITMDVVSGGQEAAGTPGGARTGSTRHDHGNAADADFYMDGRKLDWNNPTDIPVLSQVVARAKANGVLGIGAADGYMGPGRFHVGFGDPGVWGEGGKGENAPQWLIDAYNGAPDGGGFSTPGTAPNVNPQIFNQLAELAANPYLPEGQRAVVNALMQKEMDKIGQESDPMQAIELEKAQLELEQMKTGRGGTTELSLTPQYATNADGELIMLQIGKDGKAVETVMPEGVRLSKGIEKIDLGDSFIYQNVITGETIGEPVMKNLAEAERQKGIGTATGKMEGEAAANIEGARLKTQQAFDIIDMISNDPALPSITGTVQGGVLAPGIPMLSGGQAGTDLAARIENLKGKVFVQAYDSIRGAGQITEQEGAAAQAAIENLNRAQSPEAFKAALATLKQTMADLLALSESRAARGGAAPAPGQSYTFNPETGELE